MFMLPDPKPTNHRLRFVNPSVLSSEQHTPLSLPRVTQPGIGIYAYPLPISRAEYSVNEVPAKILDRWTDDFKAWWVEKPGMDANFMFELHKKFRKSHEVHDKRFVFRPSIFPRSYQYELDCMEYRRLQKLEQKMYEEEQSMIRKRKMYEKTNQRLEGNFDEKNPYQQVELPQWTTRPKLFAKSQSDPCKRRAQFQKCGQPFKSEACQFYYEHYPRIDKYKAINRKLS